MDNKMIFAKNLNRYMKEAGKTRREVCHALGFSYYTFSDWCNGKKYPRIDKVEILADYFGCRKSDLVEDKQADTPSTALELTDKERHLVESYRNNPAMQSAVDRLLGITDTSGTAATLADDLAQEINALQSTKHTATKQN